MIHHFSNKSQFLSGIFLFPLTPFNIETILKDQQRDPVLKIMYERITEKARPSERTPIITASPYLLEFFFGILLNL